MSAPSPASTTAVTPVSLPGEELLRQIAANIDAMLWSWDPAGGRITYTNPAFEMFWGQSADKLAGDPWQWLEQVDPADRDRVRQLQLAAVKRSEEYRVRRPNGVRTSGSHRRRADSPEQNTDRRRACDCRDAPVPTAMSLMS